MSTETGCTSYTVRACEFAYQSSGAIGPMARLPSRTAGGSNQIILPITNRLLYSSDSYSQC